MQVHEWLKFVQFLLPPTCILCGGKGRQPSQDLCAQCEADFPQNAGGCKVCAQPLSGGAPDTQLLCGQCQRRSPRFEVCYSPFRYAFPIDHLIRTLKYREGLTQGRLLGTLLAHYLQAERAGLWPDCIVPVPLATARYRARGYNQATELGRCLERILHIPMRADLLERVRDTAEQASLSRRKRRKNVRKAFAVRVPILEKHVAIVDDVVTTGSTVNEIAPVLRQAGVVHVEVWSVARAAR